MWPWRPRHNQTLQGITIADALQHLASTRYYSKYFTNTNKSNPTCTLPSDSTIVIHETDEEKEARQLKSQNQ
jgi:hypothetical protein